VSLDHSIDPIVPPARTAAARIACLVLVCFMEDFIVRAQPCASCLWAVDLNQQPARLVWKRDRALIFMTATLSFGSGRTSGINHTRQKRERSTSRAYRIDASTIVLITPTLVLFETRSRRSHVLYLFTEYVDCR
jgi:hypothetical protein